MKRCVVHVNNLLAAALTAGSACALAAGILTPARAGADSDVARGPSRAPTPHGRTNPGGSRWPRPPAAPCPPRVYLAGQDPAGLAAVATEVSTPDNALYGHYLSPEEVRGEVRPERWRDQRGQGLANRGRPDRNRGR